MAEEYDEYEFEEEYGMPLIGDEFPEMTVQTTKGVMDLPEVFKGKGNNR